MAAATSFVPGPPETGAQLEVRFEFDAPIDVTPGATYIIEWFGFEPSILGWMRADSDSYAGGTAFTCGGDVDAANDFIFTSYAPGGILLPPSP